MLGKKSSQKIAKYRFLYKHKYRDQTMVEKTRETIIPETPIVPAKKVGKKLSQNIAKKRFLYSHEYREQNMVEKNARNNFSRNTPIVHAKNVGKKSSQKSASKKY